MTRYFKGQENLARKPFDLSKALAGAKVVTRDGKTVTELHDFPSASESPFNQTAGVVDGVLLTWHRDGRFLKSKESERDLFLASTRREGWVNIHSLTSTGAYLCSPSLSRKENSELRTLERSGFSAWNSCRMGRELNCKFAATDFPLLLCREYRIAMNVPRKAGCCANTLRRFHSR